MRTDDSVFRLFLKDGIASRYRLPTGPWPMMGAAAPEVSVGGEPRMLPQYNAAEAHAARHQRLVPRILLRRSTHTLKTFDRAQSACTTKDCWWVRNLQVT